MPTTNRDDLFKTSALGHKEKRKQEEQNRGSNFEPVDYTALEDNKMKIFRFLGWPAETTEGKNDPFSPKIVSISMILDDREKKFRCIWPTLQEGGDWILWRITNLILAYTWDSVAKKPIYKHQNTHPTLFSRVHRNNQPPANKFEKGWKPSPIVIFNVIDRDRMDWHQKNKKTLILSKKCSESKNDKGESTFYFEPGIPFGCYSSIVTQIQEGHGDLENFDIGVWKFPDPADKIYYQVQHIEESWLGLSRKNPEIFGEKSIYKDYMLRPLTDEEKSWERVDISKLFPITSYSKIQKRLGKFIEQVDEAFGRNFTQELAELVEKEKKEEEEKTAKETIAYIEKKEKESGVFSNNKSIPVTDRPARRPAADEKHSLSKQLSGLVNLNLQGKYTEGGESYKKFVGVEKLSQDEIKNIKGINQEDGKISFEYDIKAGRLYECQSCGFLSPETFILCPDCGRKFADDGVPISY